MLGDLRVLDTGDELLLDTERVALQALFDAIRRGARRLRRRARQAHAAAGLLSLIGPRAARGRRRADGLPAETRQRARRRSPASRSC